MTEIVPYLSIAIVALLASFSTFFSGFGLGTILLPVFSLYFPLELAVLATALVHFSNNLFKFGMLREHLDFGILLSFGIPAGIGALIGALSLQFTSHSGIAYSYLVFGKSLTVDWVSVLIGILMLFFALMELLPYFERIQLPNKWLPIGGIVSGFFGGISGHQGALRSAFLSKTTLTKAQFVSTGVAISFIIDLTRIGIYFKSDFSHLPIKLILIGSSFAMIGSVYGKRLFEKSVNLNIRKVVAIFLFVMGIKILIGL